jgi:hypothetical protein
MLKLERIKLLKKHTSTAKSLKETLTISEASYLAGLIDGEGCFFISNTTYNVSIVNTHNAIVKFCNTYGGRWYYQARSRPRERPWYVWEWNIDTMKHYLPQILPYFQIKSEQAKLMIEALKCSHGTGKRKTQQEINIVKKCKRKISELNKKAYPLTKG